MRVPYLPELLAYELEQAEGVTWHYAPLPYSEASEWLSRFLHEQERRDQPGNPAKVLGELFRARLRKAEGLLVGEQDEVFDVKLDAHFNALPPSWVMGVGDAILNRAQIKGRDAGK